MSWYLVYSLCNKHGWFDSGDLAQYEKLRQLVRAGVSVHDLALVIWVCTSSEHGETVESIAEKLREAMEG